MPAFLVVLLASAGLTYMSHSEGKRVTQECRDFMIRECPEKFPNTSMVFFDGKHLNISYPINDSGR